MRSSVRFLVASFFLSLSIGGVAADSETRKAPNIKIEKPAPNIMNLEAEGNLAPTQKKPCSKLTRLNNTFTPADLGLVIADCMKKGEYRRASETYILSRLYGYFDVQRVADRSAHQGLTVLSMQTFGPFNAEQKKEFQTDLSTLTENREGKEFVALCKKIRRLGAPDYYPAYLILHGMRAFTGNPHENALVEGFSPGDTWKKALDDVAKCPGNN